MAKREFGCIKGDGWHCDPEFGGRHCLGCEMLHAPKVETFWGRIKKLLFLVPWRFSTQPKSPIVLKVSIKPENDIPAFAGYLSGSVKEPEAKIVVNIEAMVNAVADKENDITFEQIFTTSVVHELLHAIQEIYRREFDEDEVERVLEEAQKMIYGQQ